MKKINVLISTFFGCGYYTKIPGTITSLVTTIFIYTACEYFEYNNVKFLLIFFIIIFFILFMQLKIQKVNLKIKIQDK